MHLWTGNIWFSLKLPPATAGRAEAKVSSAKRFNEGHEAGASCARLLSVWSCMTHPFFHLDQAGIIDQASLLPSPCPPVAGLWLHGLHPTASTSKTYWSIFKPFKTCWYPSGIEWTRIEQNGIKWNRFSRIYMLDSFRRSLIKCPQGCSCTEGICNVSRLEKTCENVWNHVKTCCFHIAILIIGRRKDAIALSMHRKQLTDGVPKQDEGCAGAVLAPWTWMSAMMTDW